ncbi:MAG: TetR/AcrR family transcriptional regulator [Clostridiaceae bacterium]|nr:TetR/AcrR family transcriptional regulator [Clostridiaceae bacterium]
MSPKILTDQERQLQKNRLIGEGKKLLFSYGIRKTSVADITKAAGMAKGTFYQHFTSKEELFLEIVTQLHVTWFQQAELYFSEPSSEPLGERVRSFIRFCFHANEFISIFKYHNEIEELIMEMQASSNQAVIDLMDLEHAAYERLLKMFNIDTNKTKPGVVYNYFHAMYFGIANKSMMDPDCFDETFEAMLNGLIVYIFGGIS